MAIRIPRAERQVSPDVARIPTPEVATPLRASFGESVAQANQGIADTGTKIAGMIQKHAEKKAKIERDSQEESMITAFTKENHDRLFSQEVETVNIDGVDYERPKGLLNRVNADGSGEEYDLSTQERINEYLSGIQDEESRLRVAGRLNSIYMNGRNNVYKNEATNWRKRKDAELDASQETQLQEVAGAQDYESINRALLGSEGTQRKRNFSDGLGDEASELAIKKRNGDMLESSVIAGLQADPTGETSLHNLSSFEDRLSPKRYTELEKQIKASANKIIKESKYRAKRIKLSNEASLAKDVAQGVVNLTNISNIKKSVNDGIIGVDMGKAAIKAIQTPISEFTEDDEAFLELIEGVFSSKDDEQMNKVLIDILNGFSGSKLSMRNMTLLMQTADLVGAPLYEDKQQEIKGKKGQISFRHNYQRVSDFAEKNGIDPAIILKDYTNNINSLSSSEMLATEAADIAINNAMSLEDPSYIAPEGRLEVEPELVGVGQKIELPDGTIQIMNGEGKWVTIQKPQTENSQ